MASILGIDLGVNTPTFGGWSAWTITILVIILLLVLIAVVAIWIIYSNRIFKIKINVFENIAGKGWQPTIKDRARLVKVGNGGEEVLYLRKLGVYRSAYGRKMGTNNYWFAIGQDGYWYNFVLGDLDAKMGMLDIEPIDRDMRYMHVALRKNTEDRYLKKKMEKAVLYTVSGIVIVVLIVVIGGYYIAKQGVEAAKITAQNIEAVKPVADALMNAASHLDTLCSASGIRPA